MRPTVLLVLVTLTLTGCKPSGTFSSLCSSNDPLDLADPRTCTLTGETIDQAHALSFGNESFRRYAQVVFTLRLEHGAVSASWTDAQQVEHTVTATPEAAVITDFRVRLHPKQRDFTLRFAPVGGPARRVFGWVKYSAVDEQEADAADAEAAPVK